MARSLAVPRAFREKDQPTSKPATATRSKRYNLVIPEDLYKEVEELANEQQTSVVELLRRFIKLGLLATHVQQDPNGAIILRKGDTERELIFL